MRRVAGGARGQRSVSLAWPDKPATGVVPNYHLGIIRTDRSRKLAFGTVRMLVRLFNTGTISAIEPALRFDDRSCPEADLHQRLFARPDGSRVLALWTKTHGCSVSLHSGVPIRSAVEYLSDGRAVPFLELIGDELRGVTLVAGTPRIFLLQ